MPSDSEVCEAGTLVGTHETEIAFASACAECRRGNLQLAHTHWMLALDAAKRHGTAQFWKRAALNHPDLQPLWHAKLLINVNP